MSINKMDKTTLDSWVNALINTQKVIGVQTKGERFVFDYLDKASNLRLDYDVTILPPKKFFQPQEEEILRFKDGKLSSTISDESFVLFGVHPYDMAAISQMDKIFSGTNYDVHYMARREKATIVVCDPQKASENVFAGSMNTATVKKGFDVLITKVGDAYVVETATEKGETLLAKAGNSPSADEDSLKAREKIWQENSQKLQKHSLNCFPTDLPPLLEKSENHRIWAERAERCFSCGSCNLVCPTCYCFDIRDDVAWDLTSGQRTRTWDGCMLENFATVAGDHNFRKDKADRFKHRYYRKGKYIHDRFGDIACVGCGRCITACVAKIANPVEVFNQLLEEK